MKNLLRKSAKQIMRMVVAFVATLFVATAAEVVAAPAAPQMPTFRGGPLLNFENWAASRFNSSKELRQQSVEGEAQIVILINAEGLVEEAKVLSAPSEEIGKALCEIMLQSPKWQPGRQNGKVVKVRMVAKIKFTKKGAVKTGNWQPPTQTIK
ncbi:MAG: energy transducer TonB [Alistipes sp.]|nr:energy transducer TonB [Alistipes sp.]